MLPAFLNTLVSGILDSRPLWPHQTQGSTKKPLYWITKLRTSSNSTIITYWISLMSLSDWKELTNHIHSLYIYTKYLHFHLLRFCAPTFCQLEHVVLDRLCVPPVFPLHASPHTFCYSGLGRWENEMSEYNNLPPPLPFHPTRILSTKVVWGKEYPAQMFIRWTNVNHGICLHSLMRKPILILLLCSIKS